MGPRVAPSGIEFLVLGANGLVKATVGNPSDLILDFVQKGRAVPKGSTVITSGWRSSHLESLFPRGIPIGKVTRVCQTDVDPFQDVQVMPFVDFSSLQVVMVLASHKPRPQMP